MLNTDNGLYHCPQLIFHAKKKKNLNTKYNSEDLDVKKISKHGIN